MKIAWMLLAASVLGFICSGCDVNPVTGQEEFLLVSPAQEKKMGLNASAQVEKELGQSVQDQQLQDYISSVGHKIAAVCHTPNEEFSYKAIDHKSVNAFALPGGYIYITTGLLKVLNSEAQLAAVLAHETAHVTARHIAQQITRDFFINAGLTVASTQVPSPAMRVAGIVKQLEGMSFTREQERQADEVGLNYIVIAGYTPYGMVQTMEILERQSESGQIEFLSTHPNPEHRVEYIKQDIIKKDYIIYGKTGRKGEAEYKSNVSDRLVP